ncbi:hypothetical protein L1987_26061 [Smallanthus sonchifolius]|uniref:Uncharacterized protein n=1 Tax=Smallanthus sonchifolius TaxID=185202 RepID=A0ACB9I9Q0_9ASTR|nr:hypothetical protein L1987_26061 [Smallanthus sonchifolius]
MLDLITNRVDRHQLKPGDHIYSWRTGLFYSHQGIYVGGNKVIHFTGPENVNSGSGWNLSSSSFSSQRNCDNYECGLNQKSEGGVCVCCLNCFIGTGSLYLYEYGVNKFMFYFKLSVVQAGIMTVAPSDPPQDVIARANYLLQHGFGEYHAIKNNCEDFALYCKTSLLVRTGGSGQVLHQLLHDIGFRGVAIKILLLTELIDINSSQETTFTVGELDSFTHTKVIHFTGPENVNSGSGWNLSSSSLSSQRNCDNYECGLNRKSEGGVCVCCLNCFIGTGSLYLYEYGVNQFTFYFKLSVVQAGIMTVAPSDPPQDVIARANYLLQHGFGEYHAIMNNCEDFALYCKTSLLVRTGGSGQVLHQLLHDIGFRGVAIKVKVENVRFYK